ncbi:hypothetical protein ACQEVC_05390 [Plantactinospora sp. CA-294935]|uniref:hypothetical protein n=1 Tax=Plantactinospora sp. CA-294935 TaxID=3240012 RepID=UPI003D93DB68
MNVVPDELARAVHRAATAATAYDGSPDLVRRRWRGRRRRRLAVAACLVAAGVAGVPVLAGQLLGSAGGPTAVTDDGRSTPFQRLLVGSADWYATGFVQANPRGPGEIGEIGSDGRFSRHAVPADWSQGIGLPDGRIVGLLRSDAREGLRPGERLSIRLVLLGADGAVQADRPLPARPDTVLVGATGRTAYLLRGGAILGHELGTGRESQVLAPAGEVVHPPWAVRGDLRAGLLAVPDADGPDCAIQVIDLADRRLRAHLRIDRACAATVRLSSDGRLLAAVYARPAETGAGLDHRVTILDVPTGAVRADQPLRLGVSPVGPGSLVPLVGMAWNDAATIRVATGQPGATPVDGGFSITTVTAR